MNLNLVNNSTKQELFNSIEGGNIINDIKNLNFKELCTKLNINMILLFIIFIIIPLFLYYRYNNKTRLDKEK
tara:strand:+ start:82 stop:297 length:216 start_codon:yes stop_codon:yes gene_type:complete